MRKLVRMKIKALIYRRLNYDNEIMPFIILYTHPVVLSLHCDIIYNKTRPYSTRMGYKKYCYQYQYLRPVVSRSKVGN